MSAPYKMIRRPDPPADPPARPAAPPPRAGSPPLIQKERGLVAVVAVHLCFLPWALGTVHVWSQAVSLALAALGFGIALLPDREVLPDGGAVRQLLTWPFFWAGLVLMAYVTAQGSNSAWKFVSDAQSWHLVPLPHLAWLPSGVDAPFGRSNPWRGLMILSSLWLLLCSVQVGFRRRQSFRVLLSVLAANGGLLSVFGMAEQLSGTKRIFWSYVPSNPYFAASFIYRNHAGAYLGLASAVAAGLAWWHHRRARRLKESPAPTIFFAFLAGLIALMVIFSASRMATFLTGVFAVVAVTAFAIQLFRRDSEHGDGLKIAGLFGAVVVCAAIAFIALTSDPVWSRFSELASGPSATVSERAIARQTAGEMLADSWKLGWGLGCFRYGFPLYSQHHPEIYQYPSGWHKYWEHAHADLLEIPIELGLVGLLPAAVALAIGAVRTLRGRFWRNPVSFCLFVACLLTVAHGWVDFVFQCPAVLLTWAFLLVAAARWSELDHSPVRRRLTPQRASTREPGAAAPA